MSMHRLVQTLHRHTSWLFSIVEHQKSHLTMQETKQNVLSSAAETFPRWPQWLAGKLPFLTFSKNSPNNNNKYKAATKLRSEEVPQALSRNLLVCTTSCKLTYFDTGFPLKSTTIKPLQNLMFSGTSHTSSKGEDRPYH